MPHLITPMIRCEHNNASEMVTWYTDVLPNSTVSSSSDLIVTADILGQPISFLNGGPHHTLNPSISFSLWIKDQALTKSIREKLSDKGDVMMDYGSYPRSPAYGRCNDRYGVSRQIMYDNREETTQHALVPSLLYTGEMAGKTQEALNFYRSLFPDATIDFVRKYGEQPEPTDNKDFIAHAEFRLAGQQFIAMDSSEDHKFSFNDALSFVIACNNQEEVDTYRDAFLAHGGIPSQCGWLQDRYGVRWQIIPVQLIEALNHQDQAIASYAQTHMLTMQKIIIDELYQR